MDVNVFTAFGFGLLSFFTPCVWPLVPSFLIYISGCSITSHAQLSERKVRRKVLLHAVSFIVGFSVVFITMGVSSSFLGNVFFNYQKWIMRVGGLLLVVMGLHMLGWVKIPLLNQEKLVHLEEKPVGLIRSFVVGVTFSLGWTPCIGPVLASILLIASAGGSPLAGVHLLSLYSLGLAIPFFVAALLLSQLLPLMKRYGHIVRYTSYILGGLLIAIGILLMAGFWRLMNAWVGGA
jgi:cytochrome c-type biogenesis protein